jgi:hypothetical protein
MTSGGHKFKGGQKMNGIFTVKVNERTLHFKFTFRTAKAMEENAGITLSTIEEKLNKQLLADMEAIIKYALLWKNKNMTEDDLLDILDEVADAGKLEEAQLAALKAYAYFHNGPKAVKVLEAEKKRLLAEANQKISTGTT